MVQIYVSSTWINNCKVSLSGETVFFFLTVLQFYTTFRDILRIFWKHTMQRCEVLFAWKVYFSFCDSFSEKQIEVSDKIFVANILWLKSTISQNWQKLWVLYFSSNMQKFLYLEILFSVLFFERKKHSIIFHCYCLIVLFMNCYNFCALQASVPFILVVQV